MLANVSPQNEEKISLVRHVCNDGGLWPAEFPFDIQPSSLCPCKNLHTLIGTQFSILRLQNLNSTACSLT